MIPGLLLVNKYMGIYSRLRTSSGTVKSAVLSLSVLLVCVLVWPITHSGETLVLWGLLVVGPLVLPRALLNIPYSRHRNYLVRTVEQSGPVLVIGGAGYIGSHVVAILLDNGYRVRVLDRLVYGRKPLEEFEGHRNL